MAFRLGMKGVLNYKVGGVAGGGAWTALAIVRDVTLNLEKGEADMSSRANDGWRATVGTLKDASVEFEMVHDPANAGFAVIRDAFLEDEVIGIQALDEADGEGLQADCMVLSLSRAEPLEEGMVVSVTVKPTYSATPPSWIEPEEEEE
ncbi:MAG: hypothetical protein IBJ10_02225 [Phycisphaerales bacterium]|nr:hypothetical protein [Phycisphaerales bacterium]